MEDEHPKRLHFDCPLFLVLSIHQIRLVGIVPRDQVRKHQQRATPPLHRRVHDVLADEPVDHTRSGPG